MELAAYFVIALLIAMLINYLADVLPYTRKFTRPTCHHCGKDFSLGAYILGQTCPTCGNRRSFRYPLVFLIAAIIPLALWLNHVPRTGMWLGLILAGYFGLVAVIDMEHRLVLHPISIAGAVLSALIGIYLHGILPTLLGGGAGFAFMLGLYYLGNIFAKAMAKRRGAQLDEVALGFGDVNLSGICGLLLGWPGIVAGLTIGILLGGLASFVIIFSQVALRRYKPFTAIPYAPFLILGTVLLLVRVLFRLS